MSSTFKDSLPKEFVQNTIALCGDDGRMWLDKLPETIRRLEKQWSIRAGRHFGTMAYNYVGEATCSDGSATVLKIGLPLKDVEIFCEAKYLRELSGEGAIRLICEDRESQAILIERAFPGKNLTDIFEDRKEDAVAVAIELLKQVQRKSPVNLADTISLDDWFASLKRVVGGEFPQKYPDKALAFYDELSSDRTHLCYIHGDLHHENILSSTREPYLAIDPKGIIGHIGYEIAVFLNNHHWWLEGESEIPAKLDKAVRQFSDAFDISPGDLRRWAYAQMVLSAWWTFGEMPDIYNNELALADIWDV
jgi:streptomycin 6-kinase